MSRRMNKLSIMVQTNKEKWRSGGNKEVFDMLFHK